MYGIVYLLGHQVDKVFSFTQLKKKKKTGKKTHRLRFILGVREAGSLLKRTASEQADDPVALHEHQGE